jgi:hypothetical protein
MATTMPTLAKPIRALFGLTLAEAGFHNGQDQRLTGLLADEEMPVSALAHALDVRPSETGIRTQVSEAPAARLMWLRELRHRGTAMSEDNGDESFWLELEAASKALTSVSSREHAERLKQLFDEQVAEVTLAASLAARCSPPVTVSADANDLPGVGAASRPDEGSAAGLPRTAAARIREKG